MIKAQFKASDIHKMVLAKVAKIEKAIESRLIRIGLQFVIDARTKADFTDRTGNLRSSIGFIIMKEGKELSGDFEQTKDGVIGKANAQKYARELAAELVQYSRGFVLIVVAGMEYAAAVESKGKDVLTGSSITATAALNKYFKKK